MGKAVFQGTVPTVPCEEVSGIRGCRRPVPLGAEHCGIPEHAVAHPESKTRPGRAYVSNRGKRPTITVKEDFDLIGEEVGPHFGTDEAIALPDLDPEDFDPSSLKVATRCQTEFTGHHQVTPEVAIEEIRQFAEYALRQGDYERLDDGGHYLSRDGFTIWLSPDALMVTGYRTLHFERTPSQVRGGVRSRFKGRRNVKGSRPLVAGSRSIRLDEMGATVDPACIAISASAMNSFAKSHGTRAKDPLVEGWLRQELRQALGLGTWARAKDSGAYVLRSNDRGRVFTDDGRLLLATFVEETPPEAPRSQPG